MDSWESLIENNYYPVFREWVKSKGYATGPSCADIKLWYTWIEEQAKEREQKPPAPIVAPEISDAPD